MSSLLFTLFISLNIYAQKKAPVGTIWLRNNIYIDMLPVSNISYREYEYSLGKIYGFYMDSLERFASQLPYYGLTYRPTKWNNNIPANPDSQIYKITLPSAIGLNNWIDLKAYTYQFKYIYYPVVYVSREIAALFCLWRTYMVRINYANRETFLERNRYYRRITYRLPTSEEWNYAVEKFTSLRDLKFVTGKKQETLPKLKYYHNLFMLTPLSEIVSDSNIVKGPNWKNPTVSFTGSTQYKGPSDLIGFRCVCEVED